jgi:integrase
MRQLNRLNARQIANVKRPGKYSDGGNLILRVSPDGNKTFALRYMRDGRSRTMGLGPTGSVSLALARELAAQGREQLACGLDPIDERRKAVAARRAEAARLITFKQASDQFVKDQSPGWRNEQHRRDWASSLRLHILPVLGGLSVGSIDTPAVLRCLQPLWNEKPETGSRVRSRIEQILDWCTARQFRSGDNPATWDGHLDKLLPRPKAVRPTVAHKALAWAQIPAFMADLRGREGTAARALEFTILTAARISEVLGAKWSEVDFGKRVWHVPGQRMKNADDHDVPLSDRALEILRAMPRDDERIFPLVRATVRNLLVDHMGRDDATVHGMRATFRTWAGDHGFEREVAEAALAHRVGGKVERAYQRSKLLARRAPLMNAWAEFCGQPPGAKVPDKVVKLRRRA